MLELRCCRGINDVNGVPVLLSTDGDDFDDFATEGVFGGDGDEEVLLGVDLLKRAAPPLDDDEDDPDMKGFCWTLNEEEGI